MDPEILALNRPYVSNSDFLLHVLGPLSEGENAWVCTFAVPPAFANGADWGGFAVTRLSAVTDYAVNAYFSVSVLAGRRRRADFRRMSCVVLDDAPKDDGASWTLETSPNNFQVGYILRPAITDEGVANRLQEALSRQGLVKADTSGYSSVRYVRLPVGANTKTSPPHAHALVDWQPECVFTLDDLIDKFDLDAEFIKRREPLSGANVYEHSPGERRFNGDDHEYVRNVVTGADYHDSLLALSARYVARGVSGPAVTEILQGLMLSRERKDDRWKSRYAEIPRDVRGAVEKFSPKVEEAVREAPSGSLLTRLGKLELRPVQTLLRGFLPLDGVGMVWAPPAGFKSFLVLDWALSVATGREWFGNPVVKGPVWYLAGEGQQGLHLRVAAWAKARNYDGPIDDFFFSERALTLDSESDLMSPAALGLIKMIEDGGAPALIVVDTLSRSMIGDENATKDSSRYVAVLSEIVAAVRAQGRAVCVVLVHHSRKDSTVYRGSSVLRGAADFEFNMDRDGTEYIATLSCQKVKDGPTPGPITFKAVAEVLGEAPDNHGVMTSMSSLVLWREAVAREVDPIKARAMELLGVVDNILRDYPDGLSTKRLVDLIRVAGFKSRNDAIPGFLEVLAQSGHLGRADGPHRSSIWSTLAPSSPRGR